MVCVVTMKLMPVMIVLMPSTNTPSTMGTTEVGEPAEYGG